MIRHTWLISLRMRISRSIHVAANGIILFLSTSAHILSAANTWVFNLLLPLTLALPSVSGSRQLNELNSWVIDQIGTVGKYKIPFSLSQPWREASLFAYSAMICIPLGMHRKQSGIIKHANERFFKIQRMCFDFVYWYFGKASLEIAL